MPLSAPTLSVEVGFAANPLDSAVTWTDITPYVKNFSTARGRQHELGQTEAGTATLRLNNRDGRFDPSNSSSPHSPNILPMKPIRIRATYNSITYDIWRGFTETWELIWDDVASAEVELRCSDAFKLLNLKELNTPYVSEVLADSPKAYYRLNEGGGITAADSSGNGYSGTYVGNPSLGQSDPITDGVDGAMLLDGVDDGMYPPIEAGLAGATSLSVEFFVKTSSTATQELFIHLTYPGTHVQAKVVANKVYWEVGGSFTIVGSVATINDGNWHHVVCTRESNGDGKIYIDGALDTTDTGNAIAALAAPHEIAFGRNVSAPPFQGVDGSMDELAIYTTALSSTRVAAHYPARNGWSGDLPGARIGRVLDAISWPSALRNLHTGSTTLQSFPGGDTALGHAQKVAETEEGLLFVDGQGRVTLFGRRHVQTSTVSTVSQATFGDGAGELPYRHESTRQIDDLDLWNEVRVTRDNGTTQIAVDSTSQTSYGKRTLEKQAQLMNTDSEAKDKAFYLLNQNKTPKVRIDRITLHSQDSPTTLLPQMLGRELWDRVTVKHRPRTTTGYTFSQESIIERVEHRYSPGEWVTNFALSIADATQYWLIGTAGRSEIQQTTYVGY